MENLSNVKKVCGFYVSTVHLITMILPYIRQQVKENINIETFFQFNLKENANRILEKIILNDENKKQVLNINWKNTKIEKYYKIEKRLKNIIENNTQIKILVSGTKKYINEVNEILSKYINKYSNKINNKSITIINCYEVTEFDDNIREILDSHEHLLNTSGVHKIDEIFEDYKKKVVN